MNTQEDCGCLIHAGIGLGAIALIAALVVGIPALIAVVRFRYGVWRTNQEKRREEAFQKAEDDKREAMSLLGYRG